MAFVGLGEGFVNIEKTMGKFSALGRVLHGVNKEVAKQVGVIKKKKKAWKELSGEKQTEKLQGFMQSFTGMASGIFAGGMDIIGVFIQVLDKMGVFQPLMDAIGLIFQLIGATALPMMMDALTGLYDIILGMDWSVIGAVIGEFMIWLITEIVNILSAPGFINSIKNFIKALVGFAKIFMKIIGGIVWFMAALDIPGFKLAVLALVNIMAFMWGFMHGGPYGLALGIAMATAATVAVGAILFMAEGGIVTKPTFAMIGEAGPEAVVPLDEAGMTMGNDEVIWAIESNSARIERLIEVQETANRIRRLKYL